MIEYFKAIFASSRWGWIKTEWANKNYAKAITILNDSFPNLTYPSGPEVMDQNFNKFGYWKFTGPMAGVTWWREVWHFLGGFFITLPFVYFPTICMVVSIAIAIWKAAAEFYGDAQGKPDLKNFVDWLFWIAGTSAVSIPSLILFGPDTSK